MAAGDLHLLLCAAALNTPDSSPVHGACRLARAGVADVDVLLAALLSDTNPRHVPRAFGAGAGAHAVAIVDEAVGAAALGREAAASAGARLVLLAGVWRSMRRLAEHGAADPRADVRAFVARRRARFDAVRGVCAEIDAELDAMFAGTVLDRRTGERYPCCNTP